MCVYTADRHVAVRQRSDDDQTKVGLRRSGHHVTARQQDPHYYHHRGQYTNGVFTRSSKRPAIHVYFEYVCGKFATFAESCKHPITATP